ncbi:PREDICTED: uncharacterized protein LOC106741721 [Dinoponera quadriceps]|uniref:Uncharacterized protein LOC106741721 n=1 Tax=Dinoponera quadriceps TaxID=609295 RepID=A0A6P3WUZ9_DINQU|nr:PREDICTED: uncharacterized protein LOC106741721 [Dinoponera quadriceps]
MESDTSALQLRGFADASERAYAAVIYIKSAPLDGGSIMVSLVLAKIRVAPLKPISLSRLELYAAVLLVRLAAYLREQLKLLSVPVHLWFDSTITLAWIRGYPARWTTFVANRVAKIHRTLSESGPDFLKNPELLVNDDVDVTIESDLPEQRRMVHGVTKLEANEFLFTCWPEAIPGRGLFTSLWGQLRFVELDWDSRHPVILPPKSHLTRLLVIATHHGALHGAVQLTLATLRRQFWIPGGRRLEPYLFEDCMLLEEISTMTIGHDRIAIVIPARILGFILAPLRIAEPDSTALPLFDAQMEWKLFPLPLANSFQTKYDNDDDPYTTVTCKNC